jgi:hypothetical protein
MTDWDIRDMFRARPITLPQVFTAGDRTHLLCPPGTDTRTFEAAKVAFGPFSASVLWGMVGVSIPTRRQEAQDLWSLVMSEAMPGEDQRRPGGEPLATPRTATLGWRLLALLGASIEALVGAATTVAEWRESGQPIGYKCALGPSLLQFNTRGAETTAEQLDRFAKPDAASSLLGFPAEAILRRYVDGPDALAIISRCERSAIVAAELFAVASSLVADPFWRTFMKWKHGAIATLPGVAPLWIKDSMEVDPELVEDRLKNGIVVFDAQGGPKIYIWPAARLDLVGYSRTLVSILNLTEAITVSVLAYALPPGTWPVAVYEIDEEADFPVDQRAAFDHLGASAYRVAALAGLWRESGEAAATEDHRLAGG